MHQQTDRQTGIDECTRCHAICTETIQYCLDKAGRYAKAGHVRLLLDCAEICATAADFMRRGSEVYAGVCGVCAETCDRCAQSCEQVGQNEDAAMTKCAETCRLCARHCRAMSVPTADAGAWFRRPANARPLPTPALQSQKVETGVPDTPLCREATGLLREFSTPLLYNHSHRVFFWANELGRQTEQKFDAELLFVCAAFHDFGLLKTFSTAGDRFEVDSANAVRQFLERHEVPVPRIQIAWDAISLHTTPGIAAYKPLEVELLYNGVGLDVLGIGYERFPEAVRNKVVTQFPRVNFKQEIAKAFLGGFEYKTQTTEGTCNEDICSHFIRDYKRSNFYDQIQNSPFQDSKARSTEGR